MSWFGRHPVPVGKALRFEVGPLQMWIERRPAEWRVGYERGDDPMADTESVSEPLDAEHILERSHVRRFALTQTREALTLSPVLADRNVITRPEKPLAIPAHEEATAYVSTPVWLVASEEDRELFEIPIYRPSDTWFGPTTEGGELCYASRTFWRTERQEVRYRPHRAVTEIVIKNDAETELMIDRLALPVPRLALYLVDGLLWTSDVTFVRASADDFAALELDTDRSHSFSGGGATRLRGPRVTNAGNVLFRAFSTLFDGGSSS